MGNMRGPLNINVGFQKKKVTKKKMQDVYHNICKIRDSENNKKYIVLASKL